MKNVNKQQLVMQPKQPSTNNESAPTKRLFSKEYAGMNHLGNPDWPYVPSTHSDIRQSPAFKKLFETTRRNFAPHLITE